MNIGYWEVTLAVLLPLTIVAACFDYKQRRVPNLLNLFIALAGFTAQGIYNGWSGVGCGALGLVLGLVLLIVPWLLLLFGAGDVKLLAALGVWLGPLLIVLSFAAGAIICGVLVIIMIAATGCMPRVMLTLSRNIMSGADAGVDESGGGQTFGPLNKRVPYAIPISAGTTAVLFTNYLTGWLT